MGAVRRLLALGLLLAGCAAKDEAPRVVDSSLTPAERATDVAAMDRMKPSPGK